MDFMIEYISNKLFAAEEKNIVKKESSKKQINIILHQNPEEVILKSYGDDGNSSLPQVYNAQKPQRWRSQIDEMFD